MSSNRRGTRREAEREGDGGKWTDGWNLRYGGEKIVGGDRGYLDRGHAALT